MQRDIQVIFNEIKTSFKLINDHFIEDNQRNFFLGLNAEKLSYVGTPDEVALSKQKLLTLLVDHNTFKNEWNLRLVKPAGGPITGGDLTSMASKIYFFDIEKPNDLGISGVSNEGISSVDLIDQVEGDLNSAEFKYTYDARYINFSRLLSDEYTIGNEVYMESDSVEIDQFDPNQVTPVGEVDQCKPTVPEGCPLPADPNKPPPPRALFADFDNLLDLLNTIRITYNFLEGSTFKKFLGADPAIRNNLKINTYEFLELDAKERQTLGYDGKYQIVVDIPEGATDEQKENAIRAAYAEGTDAEFIVNKYVNRLINDVRTLDPSMTKLDAIRRILLGYEMMIHIHIAGVLFLEASRIGSNANFYRNILEICILNFVYLNHAFSNAVNSGDFSEGADSLFTNLGELRKKYLNYRSNLNNLTADLHKTKEDISNELDMVDLNSYYYSRSSMVFFVFMGLFIITLVGIIALHSGLVELNDTMKFKATFAIALFSIVLLVILYFINRTLVVDPETFQNQGAQAELDLILYTSYIANNTYSQFMGNTTGIIYMLDTLRGYNDFTGSISKENAFYSNYHDQLKQNKDELNNIQVEDYRQGKILQYRAYLFVQILIIISLYMMLYTYNKHYFFAIVALIILLLTIFMYIYNVNNLVHTDATKFYWEEVSPNAVS
jgi:hypothetical protein